MRCGQGTLSRPDGYVYEGDWRADAQHGQGSCRYDDGTRFALLLSQVSCLLWAQKFSKAPAENKSSIL